MRHERNIDRLINIIARLEISTRECDRKLLHTRELIENLKTKQLEKDENPYLFAEIVTVVEEVQSQVDALERDRSQDILK